MGWVVVENDRTLFWATATRSNGLKPLSASGGPFVNQHPFQLCLNPGRLSEVSLSCCPPTPPRPRPPPKCPISSISGEEKEYSGISGNISFPGQTTDQCKGDFRFLLKSVVGVYFSAFPWRSQRKNQFIGNRRMLK